MSYWVAAERSDCQQYKIKSSEVDFSTQTSKENTISPLSARTKALSSHLCAFKWVWLTRLCLSEHFHFLSVSWCVCSIFCIWVQITKIPTWTSPKPGFCFSITVQSQVLGSQSELSLHVIRLSTSENNVLQTEPNWHANAALTFKAGLA